MKTKTNFNVLILMFTALNLIACSPANNENSDARDIVTVKIKDFNKVNQKFTNKNSSNALCAFEFKKNFETGELIDDGFNKVTLTCMDKEMSLQNIAKTSKYLKSMIPGEDVSKKGFSSKHHILFNKMLYMLQKKSLSLSNHLLNIEACYGQFKKYQTSDFSKLYSINSACNEALYIIESNLSEEADNMAKTYAQIAARSYTVENKSVTAELKVILNFILNSEMSEDISFDRLLDSNSYLGFKYFRENNYDDSTLADKLREKVKEMENGTHL